MAVDALEQISFFLKKKVIFSFICMSILLVCLYVCNGCMWCLRRPGEGFGSLGTGIKDGCGCHVETEPNPDPLEEQQVLLTSGPSLQLLDTLTWISLISSGIIAYMKSMHLDHRHPQLPRHSSGHISPSLSPLFVFFLFVCLFVTH